MRLSIITPCRNAAPLLERTLHSVAACGREMKVQHLIVDGASTDGTLALLQSASDAEFISEPDAGMYDALAKGLKIASGDIVGYLNAGDVLMPNAPEILAEIFSHDGVDWVTGYSTHVNVRGQITATWKPPRYRREFVGNGFYGNPKYPFAIQQESTFWSSRLNAKIDLNRLRRFRLAGDYFLWTQFAESSELHSVMTLLGGFLIHPGQLSEHVAAYAQEISSEVRSATTREEFTAFWETRCPSALRSFLYQFTLPKSQAKIFEYDHRGGRWIWR